MTSYGFSFRESTRKGGSVGRLYLRVVKGSVSRSVTTPYRVWPDEWDAVRRRLLIPYGRSERSRQLAEYENSMLCDLIRIDAIVKELDEKGDYTVDDVMHRYRSAMTGNSLCIFTEKLAVQLERNGCVRTAKAYRTAAQRLRNLNGGRDVKLEHITPGLIGDFQHALKAQDKSMNTISFYMRTLRSIYNKAVADGRLPRRLENPFAGVYTGVSITRKLALNPNELVLLSALDPTASVTEKTGRETLRPQLLSGPLGDALAMFLFCYHARGMCFVDLAHLKKSDLQGDTIRYRRHKTGQTIEVKMLPAMRRILERFAGKTAGSSYLFPVISVSGKDARTQYESGLRIQNQRLKQIATLCGITKKLSTHCARHSWATVARNEGLPLAVISEGLGHTNQKTTEIYLASLEQPVLDHASRLVSDAITPGRPAKANWSGGNYPPGHSLPGVVVGYRPQGFGYGSGFR